MRPLLLGIVIAFTASSGPAQDAAKPEEPAKEATVVELTLKGEYPDAMPLENPFGPSPLHFRGLLDLIRKAAGDSNVAALHLRSESPALGLAKLREVHEALSALKAAGKKIYAFTEQPSLLDLLVLSVADRIEMPDSALVILPGVSAEVLYWKPLFDRLGIRFLVSHIGDFKSAYENYARRSMSPAFREVLEGLVESRYQAILGILAEGRGIPREKAAEAIDRSCLTAADLKELGLIDEVATREHFWGDVKADLGVDRIKVQKKYGRRSIDLDPNNPFAMFRLLMEAFSPPTKRSSSASKIAVVYASGMIMPGKSQTSPFGGSVLGSETLVEALKTAADDATVKAIVLRIDSPGGSGVASDAIWRAVLEAKAKKPVVASMADVAGSGGYYIAMGASRILAQNDTLTGSIGVVSALVNLSGTMDLLGVRVERITRGKGANNFSPFADPEQVSMEPLVRAMDSFYWQFVDKAAQGRGKTRDEIHAVAQGRVWVGSDALAKGLVDEIGGLRRAIQVARELAQVPAEEKLEIVESPAAPNFLESLSEAFGMARAGAVLGLRHGELEAAALIPELRALLDKAHLLLRASRERLLLLVPCEVKLD